VEHPTNARQQIRQNYEFANSNTRVLAQPRLAEIKSGTRRCRFTATGFGSDSPRNWNQPITRFWPSIREAAPCRSSRDTIWYKREPRRLSVRRRGYSCSRPKGLRWDHDFGHSTKDANDKNSLLRVNRVETSSDQLPTGKIKSGVGDGDERIVGRMSKAEVPSVDELLRCRSSMRRIVVWPVDMRLVSKCEIPDAVRSGSRGLQHRQSRNRSVVFIQNVPSGGGSPRRRPRANKHRNRSSPCSTVENGFGGPALKDPLDVIAFHRFRPCELERVVRERISSRESIEAQARTNEDNLR